MTKIITSLFGPTPSSSVLHWELEVVGLLVLAFMLIVHWRMAPSYRRNRIILITAIVFYSYLLLLTIVVGILALSE